MSDSLVIPWAKFSNECSLSWFRCTSSPRRHRHTSIEPHVHGGVRWGGTWHAQRLDSSGAWLQCRCMRAWWGSKTAVFHHRMLLQGVQGCHNPRNVPQVLRISFKIDGLALMSVPTCWRRCSSPTSNAVRRTPTKLHGWKEVWVDPAEWPARPCGSTSPASPYGRWNRKSSGDIPLRQSQKYRICKLLGS